MVLTIHHLNVSQSERVPWLCEELGIPYELHTYKRAPLLSPPEFKALHPVGSSPVVNDGPLTLAESAACVEYIARKYGGGQLFLGPDHADYATFIYWWHASNGSLQPAVSAAMRVQALPSDNHSRVYSEKKVKLMVDLVDEQLGKTEWLGGGEFTVADVMVVFSLTTMRYFFPMDLSDKKNILAYLEKVARRPAYKKALDKIDPGMELVLGPHSPPKDKRFTPFEEFKV